MSLLRLGSFAQGLRGASGNAVYVRSPYGTILRNRPMTWSPPTESQIAARDRMATVGKAWSSLTLDQATAWKRYAASMAATMPPHEGVVPPSAQNLFVRQGLKLLQIDPSASLPSLPPSDAFLGEALVLGVATVPGAIRFTPSRPNTPGITTELLLQPLRSVHRRTYLSKYRTAAFVSFGSGSHDLPVKPGVYALAYRFVKMDTGQETALAELGMVVVL